MVNFRCQFLLLLCLSIIRGQIDDCEFILQLLINTIDFYLIIFFIVVSQPGEELDVCQMMADVCNRIFELKQNKNEFII